MCKNDSNLLQLLKKSNAKYQETKQKDNVFEIQDYGDVQEYVTSDNAKGQHAEVIFPNIEQQCAPSQNNIQSQSKHQIKLELIISLTTGLVTSSKCLIQKLVYLISNTYQNQLVFQLSMQSCFQSILKQINSNPHLQEHHSKNELLFLPIRYKMKNNQLCTLDTRKMIRIILVILNVVKGESCINADLVFKIWVVLICSKNLTI